MQDGEDDDAMPGQDSFIDVVCNMVGILIVLVMIVGVRASSGGPESTLTAVATATDFRAADEGSSSQLDRLSLRTAQTQREIEAAVQSVLDMSAQSLLVDARRQQLSLVKAAVEQDIEERRSKLTGEEQRQFDVQRQTAEAEIKLHELTQQQVTLVAQSTVLETIECVPTPIATEVTEEGIYVQLRHGRLAVVPVEELMGEIDRRGADYLRNALSHRSYAQEVFGPIDGFRMRFYVERSDPAKSATGDMRQNIDQPSIAFASQFLPTTDQIGEPMEQALLPDSRFMTAMRAKRTSVPVVLAYVYNDSFNEYRTLKRALWKTGIPLALAVARGTEPIAITFGMGGFRAVAQ